MIRSADLVSEHLERRLTAILAADVAGYSRLTGLDEEGTHLQLREHLSSFVNPKIAEYRGRIVKNTGDGLLAEFSSVVDAVRCAICRELPVPVSGNTRASIGTSAMRTKPIGGNERTMFAYHDAWPQPFFGSGLLPRRHAPSQPAQASWMDDRRKRQTSTATPAEPGDLPWVLDPTEVLGADIEKGDT